MPQVFRDSPAWLHGCIMPDKRTLYARQVHEAKFSDVLLHVHFRSVSSVCSQESSVKEAKVLSCP